ncbi:hypothetical protein [Alkalibacter saccharofermentans]|nr:hypothetical protein [Alkalibacter saccharofermentans]
MKELDVAYSRESYKKIFVFVAVLWTVSMLFLSSYAFLKITGNLQEEIGSKAMLIAIIIAYIWNKSSADNLRDQQAIS